MPAERHICPIQLSCLHILTFLTNVKYRENDTRSDRERVDICPGWEPGNSPNQFTERSEAGSSASSPLTIVFGGNGAGKSAVFDAILYVLGQVPLWSSRQERTAFRDVRNTDTHD